VFILKEKREVLESYEHHITSWLDPGQPAPSTLSTLQVVASFQKHQSSTNSSPSKVINKYHNTSFLLPSSL